MLVLVVVSLSSLLLIIIIISTINVINVLFSLFIYYYVTSHAGDFTAYQGGVGEKDTSKVSDKQTGA